MTDEKAYQLSLLFFKAGKDGKPMPAIEDAAHAKTLADVYGRGREAGRHGK